MMINKRLIGTVSQSKKYVAGNVALQWCSLTANIIMMTGITGLLASLYAGTADESGILSAAAVAVLAVGVRFACTVGASRMGYLSSKAVKRILREKIYRKLLRLGTSYREQVKTSEVVQVAVEGVTKGRGFTGVIKRWNHHRLKMTHGTGPVHREVGSTGANSNPSRRIKNLKMAGQYGHERVTIQNLKVVKVDKARGVLLIRGAVPGPKGGLVTVRETVK